jgi:hypothetical protein
MVPVQPPDKAVSAAIPRSRPLCDDCQPRDLGQVTKIQQPRPAGVTSKLSVMRRNSIGPATKGRMCPRTHPAGMSITDRSARSNDH